MPAWTPRWCTTISAPKTQLFAAAIHIPIDPMAVIGPLREIPVDGSVTMLPSILLPLWDSETGKGFHRDAALDPGGKRRLLVRSFLQEVIAVEVGSRVDNPPGSRDGSASSSWRRSSSAW